MKKGTSRYNLLLLIAMTNFAKITHSLELETNNNEPIEHSTTKILVFESDSDNETTNSAATSNNTSTLSTTQPYLHVHVPATFHAPHNQTTHNHATHNDATNNPLAYSSQATQPDNKPAIQEKIFLWKILFPCCVNDNEIASK